MSKSSDYFVNHSVTTRWPFSIYHAPIERRIHELIGEIENQMRPQKPTALNVGCGLFASYPELGGRAIWSACDIDERAVHEVARLYPGLNAFKCEAIPTLPAGTYDIIVAKEVIEHVLDPVAWVNSLFSALKPGGHLLLSTPNYGVSLLPIVEYTFLEVIARMQGFSRFHIHPTKLSKGSLEKLIRAAEPEAAFDVTKESYGMVLFAHVRKK